MPVTYLIIGFTCLISIMAFQNQDLMVKMRHWPYYEKRDGEYYRWITCGFLHGDYMHLLFNMLTLYFFGMFLESWFVAHFGGMGKVWYVLFYLASLAASSSATYFKYRDTPGYASIGASGAVAAVMFATILIDPLMTLSFMLFPIPIKGFIFGILYLWYSSYAAKQGQDNIDHSAHFYGAVFGFFLPMVLEPDLLPRFVAQIMMWLQSLLG